MDAKDYCLEAVLRERQQWVIPVYQRTYSWETSDGKQLPNLWSDLESKAVEQLESGKVSPHFCGAIIYSEPRERTFSTVNRRFLVDGQQRITTFNIALCAIREVAKEHALEQYIHETDDFVLNPITNAMTDPERDRFKLWSSSIDRPYYLALADDGVDGLKSQFSEYFYKNGNLIDGQAPKMISAYCYLVSKIRDFVSEREKLDQDAKKSLEALRHGFLYGFQIVVVQLGEGDDAQSIFASLNGNAQPLSAFDLIRNDIFHRARKGNENEEDLYSGPWARLETEFWREDVKQGRRKLPRTDHLVAHTLVAERAREINVGNVANEYSSFARDSGFESVQDEIHSLLKYADVYQSLEEMKAGSTELRIAEMLKLWDISTFHPIVMWVGKQPYSDQTKQTIYRYLENYIVRRDFCGLTAKNLNKVVPALISKIKNAQDPVQTLTEAFSELSGDGSRMPNDVEIISSAENNPLYKDLTSRKLCYILRCIELLIRTKKDETIGLDNLTVEHIMPQRWAEHWPLPNGEFSPTEQEHLIDSQDRQLSNESIESVRQRESLKHTIGNLTLVTTSLNPAMGKESWNNKRKELRDSLLAINRQVCENENWNDDCIKLRSLDIGNQLNLIWPKVVSQT